MSVLTPARDQYCRPERKRRGSPYRKRLSKLCPDVRASTWGTVLDDIFGTDRHVSFLMTPKRFTFFKWRAGAFRCQLHNSLPFTSVSFLWGIGMHPCVPHQKSCPCVLPSVAEEMIIAYVSQRVCVEVE